MRVSQNFSPGLLLSMALPSIASHVPVSYFIHKIRVGICLYKNLYPHISFISCVQSPNSSNFTQTVP